MSLRQLPLINSFGSVWLTSVAIRYRAESALMERRGKGTAILDWISATQLRYFRLLATWEFRSIALIGGRVSISCSTCCFTCLSVLLRNFCGTECDKKEVWVFYICWNVQWYFAGYLIFNLNRAYILRIETSVYYRGNICFKERERDHVLLRVFNLYASTQNISIFNINIEYTRY